MTTIMRNRSSAKKAILAFEDKRHDFKIFLDAVASFFINHPQLSSHPNQVIHSVKSRIKDVSHLQEKIQRKEGIKGEINEKNIFSKVTDLVGVRVLHLYPDQFEKINDAIQKRVAQKEWIFKEKPIAYTWDPEAISYFKKLGLRTKFKESFYTSIHYLVKPKKESFLCCEIQVRTLFEEIWGEIDHAINYPKPTEQVACREQLRVLAKLVSTGTRLADSIHRTVSENATPQNTKPKRTYNTRHRGSR